MADKSRELRHHNAIHVDNMWQMQQFIDRAIYLVEHRSFPSWTRTLSEERVVALTVISRYPTVMTS